MNSIMGAHLYDIWYLAVDNFLYRNRKLPWFSLTRPHVSPLQFRLDSPRSPHPACPAHPAGAGARGECLNLESQAEISFPQGKKYYTFALKFNHRTDFKKKLLQNMDGSRKKSYYWEHVYCYKVIKIGWNVSKIGRSQRNLTLCLHYVLAGIQTPQHPSSDPWLVTSAPCPSSSPLPNLFCLSQWVQCFVMTFNNLLSSHRV